ncbi:MAG TPA: hypothetical protein VFE58_19945 [Tepidisphaeraceae bacterium]|nr:hypothetical protein [Tepidisphaeraceae bacterium]
MNSAATPSEMKAPPATKPTPMPPTTAATKSMTAPCPGVTPAGNKEDQHARQQRQTTSPSNHSLYRPAFTSPGNDKPGVRP